MHEAPILITHPDPGDIPALERLWIDTFGDPAALVEDFFDCFPPMSCGWIVCRGSEILSSAYLLPGNVFLSGERVQPAAYVYAVATPKQHRGQGYGGMLMRHFASLAAQRGLLLYTKPASTGLYHWYAETMSTVPVGRSAARTVVADSPENLPEPMALTASEYGELRERALLHTPHIAMSDAFLALQERFLKLEGGGYFAVGDACCAYDVQEQTVVIRELFSPTLPEDAVAAALRRQLGAERAVWRVPEPAGEAIAAVRTEDPPPDASWGLLLD